MPSCFLACSHTPGIPVLSLRYGAAMGKTGVFLHHFYADQEAAAALVASGARAMELAQTPSDCAWDIEAERTPFAQALDDLDVHQEHARQHGDEKAHAEGDDVALYLYARGVWHAINTRAQAIDCLAGGDAYALTPALFEARCGISADDLAQPINTDPRGTVYGTLVDAGDGAYRVLDRNTSYHIAAGTPHARTLAGLVRQGVKMLPVFLKGRGDTGQPGAYAYDATIAWIEPSTAPLATKSRTPALCHAHPSQM